jgi:hypothetical protein
MNTYTIVLERSSTGEQALSMVTRHDNEQTARAYAEAAIAQSPDLRVAAIHMRASDTCTGRGRNHHALHLNNRYSRERAGADW